MKITGKSKVLINLLSKVAGTTSSSKDNPVLQGILLSVSKEEISATATDGEKFVKASIKENSDLHVSEGGCVIVKSLLDFLKKGGEDFELSYNGTELHYKGEFSEINLSCIDSTEFPNLPDFNEKEDFVLDGTTFGKVLRQTLPCSANDETRPILTGVNIVTIEGELYFSATDSHQMSRLQCDINTPNEINVTIPGSALEEMEKIFCQSKKISFSTNGQLFVAKDHQTTYFARILEGTYPDTSKFVQDSFGTILRIDRPKLQGALEQVGLLIKEEKKPETVTVKAELKGSDFIISGQTSTGKINIKVPVGEIQGEEDGCEFYFTNDIFKNIVKISTTEEVQIGYNDSLMPIVVLPSELNGEYKMFSPVRSK